ncbi:MAG: HAMP domain-containing histidine kinase [Phycisphaerales bacterium]|nr:HAMP domain-containing histidine kinase [Phycisphaerales bacterium]
MVPESSPDIKRLAESAANEGDSISAQAASTLEKQLDGLEDRLMELQHQVQQLQRMASLGTVATILAHEFNNLLTPILTYSQYALTRDDPELSRTAVEMAQKNGQQLSVLCSKILGMAVDNRMGPSDAEITPLLHDAVTCVGRDLDKDDIELTIDAPEDLKARAHAGSLQQVLFNLVLNARHAMLDGGGQLKLVAQPTDDRRVRITVTDTGSGIKPEHMDQIFEPFFTTKQHQDQPDRHGLGLGLHVCRQLMEEQDGCITVESQPGKGTTFTLLLPAAN